MKIDLKKVLAVSEHSGLYLFISDSKSGVIVESLTDKKRTCMSSRAKMTSLADISVFTETGEVRLREVLERIKSLSAEKDVPDPKSDVGLLRSFFKEVIPDYDGERFYPSHQKKVAEWFRLLSANDMLEFEEEEDKVSGEDGEAKGEAKEEGAFDRSGRAGFRQPKGAKPARQSPSGRTMTRKGGRGE